MKNPKSSIAKFLYTIGGGILLFALGLSILFWIAIEILFPAPKICVSDIFDLKSTHATPQISEGLELIGHFGGSVQSVFTTNSYAYAGIGSEIAVLDIADPSHPQRVGYSVLPDKARDIYVDGNYAYAAVGKWGFRIIDISNPANPFEVGAYSTSVPIQKIVVSEGYAYLPLSECESYGTFLPTRCSGAVQIIDVSEPSDPIQVRCHKMKGTPASIVVDEDFAYISEFVSSGVSEARLLKMDISNPRFARVTKVHYLDFGGKITMNNDYLYISARYDKFRILNISNPFIYLETGLYDSHNPSGTRNAIFDAVVFEKHAYLVVEDVGIQVLDISNSTQPVLLSTYVIDNEIKDISLGDGYVVIATENDGIQIIDITNPSNPIQTGVYESPKSVTKLEVINHLIYAAAEDNGFRIIDASNPNMPFQTGHYKLPQEVMELAKENDPAYITGVAIEGNQAYLAVKDIGVQVVEISDPFSLTGTAFHPFTNDINDIAISNNSAYISTRVGVETTSLSSNSLNGLGWYNMPYSFVDVAVGDKYVYVLGSHGLLTADLSEPGIFNQVGFYELDGTSPNSLAVDGEYAYIGTTIGLHVISLSDTDIPTTDNYSELGRLNIEDLLIEGNYAYAATSNGLSVLDISNPLQPAVKGSYETENWTYGLAKEGNYIYLVVKNEGVWIMDVSIPSNPTRVGSYTQPEGLTRGVAVAGNYAYIAGGGDGFRILDVTNPVAPIEISSLDNIDSAQDISIAGNFAFVAHREGLAIVDITNPYKSSIVKQYNMPNSVWRQSITLAGNYAYLPSHDDGLWIVNITKPSEPDKIYYHANIYEITGIDIQADYAYIAADGDGLRIVNISETMTATEVGVYQEAGINAHDVAVFENLVYIANLRSYPSTSTKNDLVIIDISDPSNPVRTGSYELPWDARGVDVDGKYIYIATGTDGIFIFQIK